MSRRPLSVMVQPRAVIASMQLGIAWANPTVSRSVERRLVNALHVAVGQRLVLPAFHAGADRSLIPWNWPRPQGPARFTAAAARGKVFDYAHFNAPESGLICANFGAGLQRPQILSDW